eukprot:m.507120 g.507120  ORF g.507120 m.507120 type:complete len:452 (+) comp21878_c0_seq6:100-1455(+)
MFSAKHGGCSHLEFATNSLVVLMYFLSIADSSNLPRKKKIPAERDELRGNLHSSLVFAVGAADYSAQQSNISRVHFYSIEEDQGTASRSTEGLGITGPLFNIETGPNPSWLCKGGGDQKQNNLLYACLETTSGNDKGGLAAVDIERRQLIGPRSVWPTDGGKYGPAHCEMDNSHGGHIMAASYALGEFIIFPQTSDGGIGDWNQKFTYNAGSHAHCVVSSPDGTHVFVVDLGLDRIHGYKWLPSPPGAPNHNSTSVTAGFYLAEAHSLQLDINTTPRHMVFAPAFSGHEMQGHAAANVEWALLLCEKTNLLMALPYIVATGVLGSSVSTVSSVPSGWNGVSYGGEVLVHPSGKFVYTSNRGHDSVGIFAFEATTSPEPSARLSAVRWVKGGISWPRGMGMDPSGNYLVVANQQGDHGNTIIAFRIEDGGAKLTAHGAAAHVASPTDIQFLA